MMLKMVEAAVPINLNLNLHLRPSIPATISKKKPGLGRAPLKKISYAVFASSSPAPGSFKNRTFDGKLLPKSELGGSNRGRWANRKRVFFLDVNPLCYDGSKPSSQSFGNWVSLLFSQVSLIDRVIAIHQMELATGLSNSTGRENLKRLIVWASALSFGQISWLLSVQVAYAAESIKTDAMYEIGEFFELGIQLSYLLLLLALLGLGSFFVIRQVLVRRELDLSAKELQEQVRSGDASATELFELGAVMLRRKFYPAATKYLLEAIDKWDGDDQDLAQVHNALGVTYVRDGKLDKGIAQFRTAVKLQPGYVTAWNNLGDAHEKNKDLQAALNAFEEALLFDPTNKVARPRRDVLKDRVSVYKGVPVKSKDR